MLLLSRHYILVACFVIIADCCATCFGQSIRFDAPAIVEGELSVGATDAEFAGQQIVRFVIPISATFERDARVDVAEISAQVHWNRDPYPIVEFSPRTAMQSAIEGAISIERHKERSANSGLSLSSGYLDMVSGGANLGLAGKSSETRRYNEIPQHDVLNSSGTIYRGTGAEFRFKPSRTSTLEGGRDLVVTYRVPESWRTGILQVTCRAAGKRRMAGLWAEDFDQGTTFIVPVYLKGDDQARTLAGRFIRAEQTLRREAWAASDGTNAIFNHVQSLFGKDRNSMMAMSIHRLIQSGGNSVLNETGLRFPGSIEDSARQFIVARRELMNLNR